MLTFKHLTLNLIMVLSLVSMTACNYSPEFQQLDGTLDLGPVTDTPIDPPGPGLDRQSDSFIQNSANTINKVDIVWVVDNSGSMQDDQQAIAANFAAFIGEFLDREINFKMGITTTDAFVENGQFVHPLDMLTADAAAADRAQFISDFENTIKVGTNGSGYEKVFTNMLNSTTHANNAGFYRQDALTAYILVSDEKEQSGGDVSTWVNSLLNFKNNDLNYLRVYPIHRVFGNQDDQRYIDIAAQTNGFTADIEGNFYENLRDIGATIVNLLNSFTLTKTPYDPTTIKVYVEGTEVTTGWSYNAGSNTIVFDVNAVPEEGSEINVVYDFEVI